MKQALSSLRTQPQRFVSGKPLQDPQRRGGAASLRGNVASWEERALPTLHPLQPPGPPAPGDHLPQGPSCGWFRTAFPYFQETHWTLMGTGRNSLPRPTENRPPGDTSALEPGCPLCPGPAFPEAPGCQCAPQKADTGPRLWQCPCFPLSTPLSTAAQDRHQHSGFHLEITATLLRARTRLSPRRVLHWHTTPHSAPALPYLSPVH